MGVYEGRATRGIALDITWGGVFLFSTILFIVIVYNSGDYNPGILILIASMGLLTIWLFAHLYFAASPKKLVVNDMGVFLYRRNRLIKKLYWNEVHRIVSSSFGGKYSRVGFSIKGEGKKVIDVNDRDVMGPAKTLKKAFKEIAEMATSKGIIIDDFLGWAPNIVGGMEEINLEELEGKWYKVEHITAKTWVEMSIGIMVVGAVVVALNQLLSLGYGDTIFSIGIVLLSMGILILLGGVHTAVYFPDEIYFDEHEVRLRSTIGKERKVPWYRVQKVSCVEDTGFAIICEMWNNCYHVKPDTKICKALKLAFKRHKY